MTFPRFQSVFTLILYKSSPFIEWKFEKISNRGTILLVKSVPNWA